jgi:hypothetical protein
LVLHHDILRYVPDWDPRVLKTVHWIFQVKILDVEGGETGAGGGNDAVEKQLGGSDVGDFGGHFPW